MILNYQQENSENPKLLEGFNQGAFHQVFCYAAVCEDKGRDSEKLLMTIISGSDSALQSLKATIDIGTHSGVKFGFGERELTGYKFVSEQSFSSDKGKYEN